MYKERTKTLVELWNEVGENPPKYHDKETPYYPRRNDLGYYLETILEMEFSSTNMEWERKFVLKEKQFTGDETPRYCRDEYSSITLNDFRSNFDWEEKFTVEVTYPYQIETSVSEYFECTSKDDVRKYMSGSETSWDQKYHSSSDFDDGNVVFFEEDISHTYLVYVTNLRLKESVVKDMNVSVT